MLSNAYFLAIFGFDKAENEPAKILQIFANFPGFANLCSAELQPAAQVDYPQSLETYRALGERFAPPSNASVVDVVAESGRLRPSGAAGANFFGGAVWGNFRENANSGDPPG